MLPEYIIIFTIDDKLLMIILPFIRSWYFWIRVQTSPKISLRSPWYTFWLPVRNGVHHIEYSIFHSTFYNRMYLLCITVVCMTTIVLPNGTMETLQMLVD